MVLDFEFAVVWIESMRGCYLGSRWSVHQPLVADVLNIETKPRNFFSPRVQSHVVMRSDELRQPSFARDDNFGRVAGYITFIVGHLSPWY
jgi:hypothetical protein